MLFSELIHHGMRALRGASSAWLLAGSAVFPVKAEMKTPGINVLSALASVMRVTKPPWWPWAPRPCSSRAPRELGNGGSRDGGIGTCKSH